jgi:spermidine/putrescine-binding protein
MLHGKRILYSLLLTFIFACFCHEAFAEDPTTGSLMSENTSANEGSAPSLVTQVSLIAGLSVLPFAVMLLTSYMKVVIVLSLLRNAIGVQQAPPNQVLNGIALLVTIYVMFPTGLAMYNASSEYINALANGDICLALGWAGDSFQARNRAKEAGNGVEIDYVIPKEGSLMSMDALAIPKDAPHLNEAYAFLDYLLRPDVAARNSDAIQYANGVIASKPFMDKSVLENRAIYPAPDVMSRLFTVNANDLTTQRLITREWTRVKTGR